MIVKWCFYVLGALWAALTWSGDVMFNDPEVCKQEATHINVWDKLYNEDLDRGRVTGLCFIYSYGMPNYSSYIHL